MPVTMHRDGEPRVTGISRVSDNNRVLALSFTVPPTDDEMRAFHAYVRAWPGPNVLSQEVIRHEAASRPSAINFKGTGRS